MFPIQPVENRALLTFGRCQPINGGVFYSTFTSVVRCMKSFTVLHKGIQESFECWGEGLHYMCGVDRTETVCLLIVGVNCLWGRYSTSDLLRGSIGSMVHVVKAKSIRIFWLNALLKASVCHPVKG